MPRGDGHDESLYERLIPLVPIGLENAIGWNEIAKLYGEWSPITIRIKLERLVASGKIKRTSQKYRVDRERHAYYREHT